MGATVDVYQTRIQDLGQGDGSGKKIELRPIEGPELAQVPPAWFIIIIKWEVLDLNQKRSPVFVY